MSLSETQEIMSVLQELMDLLNNVEFKTKTLNAELPKTKEALITFSQLERVALRFLTISRRMGLSDNVMQATQRLSQLIIVIRMAQMSYRMLSMTTPYGVLMGIAGGVLTTFAVSDIMMEISE